MGDDDGDAVRDDDGDAVGGDDGDAVGDDDGDAVGGDDGSAVGEDDGNSADWLQMYMPPTETPAARYCPLELEAMDCQ